MRRLATTRGALVWALTALAVGQTAHAGRYEGFTKKAAKGPHMKVAAATYFGGKGIEEFVDAAALPDGTLVAFGNAWGPEFPDRLKPVVLGDGKHHGLEAVQTDRRGRQRLLRDDPDAAGMMVFYSPELQKVRRVVKFDWGVASISAGAVAADGKGLILAGRCTPAIVPLGRKAPVAHSTPVPERAGRRDRTGPYTFQGVELPGNVYVARLSPDGARLQWIWVLQGLRRPPDQLWQTRGGDVIFQCHGIKRISADGKTLRKIAGDGYGGRVGVRAVDPSDGSYFFGGDNNTSTGREPWRRPYLYKADPSGEKLWRLWGWDSHRVGTDRYRMVSDSSARQGLLARNGDLVIAGWSDGGNSVFSRQPDDLDQGHGLKGFGMSCWGMKSASSLGWLMRIDTRTHKMKAFTMWVGYVPQDYSAARYRGAPNGLSIRGPVELSDGSIAFTGGAATGLVQTPNAFYRYAGDGKKHGGTYVAVFNADFSDLRFSSYLPGCEDASVAAAPGGALVVSRSRKEDAHEHMGQSPTVRAEQETFGGRWDGHAVLLKLPSP